MGHQCCSRQKVKRGLWSPEEDEKLMRCIATHGHGCWSSVPKLAGLERCGKSCRLRWINYLRPDLKRGSFSAEEERIIIDVHRILGNRWAQIAKHLPGRTDNEVKNFWNSCIKKKLIAHGLDPTTHNLMSSHQASSKSNACSLPRVFQQPTSVFTVNSQIKDGSMDVNPPFVTLPLPPPHPDISSGHPLPYHEAMTMPTFENQQQNLVWTVENQNSNCTSMDFGNGSSRKSTPISSSSINSSGFGFLDENCMWNTGVEGFEILIEEEINQQQMAQKQKTCEMEFDKINGVKGGEDLETSFNSLNFDLEFMESTLMPCEIYGNAGLMDQLEWDF